MKLKFLGAARTVTGSKYLLTSSDQRILIDCGLFQGKAELRKLNWSTLPISANEIDVVVLTHAHIDHTGYLPVLFRQNYKGTIYCTAATKDLTEILLKDSAYLQEEDARRANLYGYSKHVPAVPLYTVREAEAVMNQFQVVGYGIDYSIGNDIKLHLSRSGHILGSAFLTFRNGNTTIVFSGDLGRPYNPIMKPPATIQTADYLILESTYGDRLHSIKSPIDALGEVINQTVKKGGIILIPSFAVERSQEVMYLLYKLKEANKIPDIPIFLDSPLAQNATSIMEKYHNEHRLPKEEYTKAYNIARYIRTVEESKSLNTITTPCVIISASGMAEGGRVLHHLKRLAKDHHNSIVFAGFQVPDTRGDKILRGDKEVKIHGEMVPIRARVSRLDSLSNHADYEEILKWLEAFTRPPSKVFLTHGNLEAAEHLAQIIETRLGWTVEIPEYLSEVPL